MEANVNEAVALDGVVAALSVIVSTTRINSTLNKDSGRITVPWFVDLFFDAISQ